MPAEGKSSVLKEDWRRIGEYRYAKSSAGGRVECAVWHHFHWHTLECADRSLQGQLLKATLALQHLSDRRLYLPAFQSTE